MLSFHRLAIANRQRCEEVFYPLDSWSPTDWATAMAGECGEACNLIKKMRLGQDIDLKEVGAELADLVIYVDLLASRLGLDLENCLIEKFNQVSAKKGSEVRL
jgi:NTP pyrophosphatase (non-canonical NTP hydrolase)